MMRLSTGVILMNRERSAWLLSFLLLSIVAFKSPTAAQRDSDYTFVRTLVDINRQILTNYVEPVEVRALEQAAINGLLEQLDPFSVYIPPSQHEEFHRRMDGRFRGVGIELNQLPNGAVEVVTPIDGSPAFKAGVKAGDIILKVDGESVEGLRLPEVIKRITGEVGTEVTLTVRHLNGAEQDLAMRRQDITLPTVRGYRRNADDTWEFLVWPDPKIAYLRITQFTPTTFAAAKPIIEKLLHEGMEGLILDLRWNPGGHLDQAVRLVDLFIDKGTIVVTRGRNRPEYRQEAGSSGTLPWFPLLVLVNEHSASAAEIVAGSLLDNKRAAVLGERTYGKGSVPEPILLDGDNGQLKLTVAYYYLPSGRLVHRKKDAVDWGVEPQIRVPMDDDVQRQVVQERSSSEKFLRPQTAPATQPAATQPVDVQLQRAIDTMVLMTVLQQNQAAPPGAAR
jgi:carboxyl-terminal processing protease